MAFEALLNEFKYQLKLIEQENLEVIVRASKIIALCTNVLTVFRKEIVANGFENVEEEIWFFKYVKQVPLVPLIYNTEVRSFELQYPKGNSKCQKIHIENKINKINRFFRYNTDFSQYVDSDKSHFDLQYYTRDYLELSHISYSMAYFQDPEFSSARDLLLGKLNAYKQFVQYLQYRMNSSEVSNIINAEGKLRWTSSQFAMTELIYSLYHSNVINNGNLDIKELAKAFEFIFQFDSGDIYKNISEIKFRKKSRTKFLDELIINLLNYFDRSEE